MTPLLQCLDCGCVDLPDQHSRCRRCGSQALTSKIYQPKETFQVKHVNKPSQVPNEAVIYAFAHCETWLEDYSKSHHLPQDELTGRVAGLLLAQTSGEVLGTFDYLPSLRRDSASVHQASRSVEMARSSYREAQKRIRGRAFSNLKGYSYKGTHWTQQPKNKARLMRQIKQANKTKAAKREAKLAGAA